MENPKTSNPKVEQNVPVSKQTAGGVTGAVIGGVIAGPVGAVIGGVAGAMMGNRAAEGKSLVSPGTVEAVKTAAKGVKAQAQKVKPLRKMIGKAKNAMPSKSASSRKTTPAKPSAALAPSKAKRVRAKRPGR